MLTPLEYLLININMVFLADSYFEYDYVYKAAHLVNAPETLHVVDLMMQMQLVILVFFVMKLSLTASRCINFELQELENEKESQDLTKTPTVNSE